MSQKLKIKLIKSLSGRLPSHIRTVKGLGLTKLHGVVELEDSPAIRGMLRKVSYMLEEVTGSKNAS